jgi:preprotein translocase subunit YajC
MLLASFATVMQQAAPGARPQGNMLTALVPFILVFVIFYVLIILPSRKKQKKHQDMVEALKPGDKIITTGGVYGTVMGTQKDRIELKIAANVKIDVTRNAIAVILGDKKEEK